MRRLISLAARLRRSLQNLAASIAGPPAGADPADVERHRLKIFRFKRSQFDSDYYLDRNPGVVQPGEAPFDHFLRLGVREGRRARFFEPHFYLRAHADLSRAGWEPYAHYRAHGRREQRDARFVTVQFQSARGVDYEDWYARHARRRKLEAVGRAPSSPNGGPLISVVMAAYNSDLGFLDEAIESVLTQSYRDIELCIADDASTDPGVRERILHWAGRDDRIKYAFRDRNGHISAATNSAIRLASGQYVAFMDHDDELADDALLCVARHLASHPECVLLYSDEDKIDERGGLSEPHFKPDFNYELLLAQNYINHLTVVRADDVRGLGGLRPGFEGAQDHDFLLRLCRTIPQEAIQHLPEVLYHWRMTRHSTASTLEAKPYVQAAAIRALSEHCEALGDKAEVTASEAPGCYRVAYALPEQPKVSVIIPTRDRVDLLRRCIDGLIALTDYPDYEIIVADNDSSDPETRRYFADLAAQDVRVVPCPGPFNFARINNLAAAEAGGEFLVLLNNDIEVTQGDWMTEMMRYAVRPDIGCVGARLWFPDMTLQHGGVILGIGSVAGHSHKDLSKGAPGYFCRAAVPQQLSAVTAACLMVRRSTFLAVKGLDEALAVNFNDVDFCLRVERAGYRNVWTPYAQLVHHESKSRGHDDTPEKQARVRQEVELMQARWGSRLLRDPFYSPHLTLEREDFSMGSD